MKILLITPNYFVNNLIERWNNILILGKAPVLGLGSIAAQALRKNHEVKILDMIAEPIKKEEFARLISEFKPELVGINITNPTIKKGVLVARFIKMYFPQLPIVVGGPAIEIFPHETMYHQCFDYGLQGEADYTFTEFLDYLQGQSPKKPQGLVYREKGEVKIFGKPPIIHNLDELPLPAYHLYHGKYMHIAAKKSPFSSIMTARGCPYHCGFCSKVPHWNHLRVRSVNKVIEEFKKLAADGVKEINIYDDTFTSLRQRTIDICKGLIKENNKIIWAARTRADSIDEELLDYLKKAGCYRLHIGIESGSNEILKKMNKMVSVEKIKESVNLIKKFGLEVVGYFMVGYPGESLKTMEQTKTLIKELPLDFLELNIFHITPASPIYDETLRQGKNWIYEQWRDYTYLKRDSLPLYHGENTNPHEVEIEARKIFRSYHFSPRQILKYLKMINTWTRLKNYLKGFFKVMLVLLIPRRIQKYEYEKN